MSIDKKPIAIDLFAGAGGLSEGLHLSGWDVALAIDKDKFCCDTYNYNHNYRLNRNTTIICNEIEKITHEELLKSLWETQNLKFKDIDLIAGGPPCQGFSHIGPRMPDDPRNRLFLEFARIIYLVKPKVFFTENVKGILTFAGRRMAGFLTKIFDALGYHFSYLIINAIEFGVPQDRPRVIFLGIRKDIAKNLNINILKGPASCIPDLLRNSYDDGFIITVREALSDLPLGKAIAKEERIWVYDEGMQPENQPDNTYNYPGQALTPYQQIMRRNSDKIYDNHTKGISQSRLKKVKLIPEGGIVASGGRSNSWRRLNWERYAHTLQAHMGRDLKDFIHPSVSRWITIREAARLQSFDDAYRFLGPQTSQLRQIGNAVPPFIGWAVGKSIGTQTGLLKDQNIPLRDTKQELSLLEGENESRLLKQLRNYSTDNSNEKNVISILHQLFDCLIDIE